MADPNPPAPPAPPPAVSDERWREADVSVTTEIGRSETKGAAMLQGIGIPFAVVVAVLPNAEFSGLGALLAGVGIVGLVLGLVAALLLIRPGGLRHRVPGTFLSWYDASDEEIVQDLAAVESRPARLRNRSRVARRKFLTARVADDAMVVAVIALGAALIISLF